MRSFCTYFDINYLPYAKALSFSLEQNLNNYKLYIVCMDDEVEKKLNKNPFPNSSILSHKELIEFRPILKEIMQSRSKVEYFFTCSAQICELIFSKFPKIEMLTYIDSDIYFFDSPEPIFNEINGYSVGIIEHKFHWMGFYKKKYGRFNVGWINFRNDKIGRSCLSDWATNCIEWCYQRLEDNKYADQKYLDDWPKKYPKIKIIKNIGANLAIWNIKNYRISIENNRLLVNNYPLIFYHFAGLKQINFKVFKTELSSSYIRLKGPILDYIYLPYVKKLLHFQKGSIIISKKEYKLSNFVSLFSDFFKELRSVFFYDRIEIK